MNGRQELASSALRLQAGGTLNPRRHVYIERPEDAEALRLLIAGEYVNILSSRQMGKSSLMVRVVGELKARGVRVATADLAGEIGAPPDADTFYLSLLRCIARELVLEVALDDWWQERSTDSINRRFIDFFQTVVLVQIKAPIVVFFDEIDSTLRLRYTDDLFTAIRGMYNQRATSAIFDRLVFCLLGVATPNELIKDRRTTPYNIGTTMELRDFDAGRDDLRILVEHLDSNPKTGLALLKRVLYWTDGQPYLTVKLCAELAATETGAAVNRLIEARFASFDEQRADSRYQQIFRLFETKLTDDAVNRHITAAFISLDQLRGDLHFQPILRFLETRMTDGLAALKLYARIAGGQRELDQPTIAHAELKLSGLVKRDGVGCLVVRNEIYRRLFGAEWAAAAIPTGTRGLTRRWYRIATIAAAIVLATLITGGADISSCTSVRRCRPGANC